ncbi:coiled-coil domain-containing protein 40 isoform X1 [Oncorhynchus keta]|uniref:coiled-coil domain-containing protein 40 isoform X1 n=1 Tax=Oncorhynchus keta TaxID=8018 RepID=UPI0015FB8EB8|nr:coiled-coil domain-containing protein 40 isoform X1 [Oncorhynchus keta]XP_035602716.1 coiled-coil domain-containing protein 40 isoform X1 [Oncorhynchus keta]XP_035602717.1 coiled-coil domain-containing protein 40 isoform X1 [Oncorhynchus keta]XP_035602718.1 coiled-coil domain-containing protein 40 isoform X1 [Oncorhynchus keta]XP_035602719.1 coiled-coil domain-containing protein 40 isoform X1 [Oncorhynchus keta]XP_035602720.1 coiled-coil domain-containing protein 40 isoform X1 [Oncorhynchus
MEGGGSEGGGEEERRGSPPQEEGKYNEQPGGADEAAEDSGVTVLPGQEGGSAEQSDREQAEAGAGYPVSQSGNSGTGAAFNPASNSDNGTMPLPPHPSLHLSVPLSDSDADGLRRAAEEGDEEDELIVLDPEHPLMRRFQTALRNHLHKQLERLNMELREKMAIERSESDHREELGVELYGIQQELARLQACLEGRHETNAQAAAQRRQAQDQLEGVRSQYRTTASQAGKQRSHVSQLQSEVENLALRLFYMQEVNADLRSDITAMKNASRKAYSEKTQAEEQKHKQDLYVERLTKHMERLTEQIALYKVQTIAQSEETQAAKEALSEAQMEMDSLGMERKQLLQQWNSSLVGMRRRDDAYTAMVEALRAATHQVRSLDTEIEGFKKSITQEGERNELLTVLLNRTRLDSATSRKLISHSHSQQEALQVQYSIYMRTLQETEQTLQRGNTECGVRQVEVSSLRKQTEKEWVRRIELEDRIVSKMQEHLTHDKATKYSRRLTDKMAAHKREKETQLSRLENEMAAVTLESSDLTLRLEGLARTLASLETEMSRRNELLGASEARITKRVTVIERKQATINVYNKKIEQLVACTGHEDLGPLEIQASTLTKQLEAVGGEIKEQQQLWLRQQGELVRLTQEKQARSAALLTLQTQFTILQQRKVRTESEIQQEQREQAELERHMKELMADMLKLNSLLSENRHLHQALEQGNVVMETDFLHRLKEAERNSIETQMKLERIQEEKDRLFNSLVESERQIMLWEKKTQLVRETRSAVDSEVGQGDIRTMRAEIHRMEVRYGQLMKQQERLLREMEGVVARRETIVMRSEAQARTDRKQPTHTDFHGILQGLRRKILDTQKQAEECDGVLRELQQGQASLSCSLRDKQLQLGELHSARTVLTSDFQCLQDTKERNLARLVSLQGHAKQLQAVREGRYSALSTSEALEPALQRQEERLHAVTTILHRVQQEFPQHQGALRRLSLALAARLQTPIGQETH